ncbi:MAG: hypothetical protein K8R67_09230 [Desulfobacteraceae bacterium]|nr:hypothetical protein [Desulfobacteraceae bacterium]
MKNSIKSIVRATASFIIVFSLIFAGQASGASSAVNVKKVPRNSNIKKISPTGFAGKPDLKVQMVKNLPKTPSAGLNPSLIDITVKNRGTAPTSAVCHLTMSIYSVDNSGSHIAGNSLMSVIPPNASNIPILGPGKSHVIRTLIPILQYAGRNKIEGVINTESLQPGEESNSQNNYYKTYFTVKHRPAPADLVLHNISLTSNGQIKIRISNSGNAIPDYDFARCGVKVEVPGYPIRYMLMQHIDTNRLLQKPGVPVGTSNKIYVSFSWPKTGIRGIELFSGNSYSVKVTLDHDHLVMDKNRSNNSKTVTLSP